MEPISRNVILDLLPAVIAGEASTESRALVEAFAQQDTEIAAMMRAGKLESTVFSEKPAAPDGLEMKTMKRVRRSIRRQMVIVALATAAILMVPLIAMQFSSEVNWNWFDFVFMGSLLSGTGLVYVLITRLSDSIVYRIAVGLTVVAGLLLIWVNGAVGIIGSENNPANLLYAGVFVTGLVGAGISRLRPGGMAHTLFATAIVQMVVPVVALVAWRPAMSETPGIAGVFMGNAFFAGLFVIAGLLFRRAGESSLKKDPF